MLERDDEVTIEARLSDLRGQVDAALERYLPAPTEDPPSLHEAMRYAVFGGGKRLRPVCCVLACQAVGGDPHAAMPAAVALELVHTYSLVHDDLPCMDDDDYRRGRLTVHKVFGESMGVLAGDALLTHAFEVIARELPPAQAGRACAALAAGAGSRGMVGGQVGDLEAEGKTLPLDRVLSIDAKKTAALFAASFRCGAICGGADRGLEDRLGQLGHELGVAFQIVDDLLDLTASAAEMGKATGKDAARGKATLPSLLGIDGARSLATAHTERALELAAGLAPGGLIEALIATMLRRTH